MSNDAIRARMESLKNLYETMFFDKASANYGNGDNDYIESHVSLRLGGDYVEVEDDDGFDGDVCEYPEDYFIGGIESPEPGEWTATITGNAIADDPGNCFGFKARGDTPEQAFDRILEKMNRYKEESRAKIDVAFQSAEQAKIGQ